MSIVVCDVDNQYCRDLTYSYQIVLDDDDTYYVYVWDAFKGKCIAKGLECFQDAWMVLNEEMQAVECI